MRKATFKVINAKPNSTAHNNRTQKPKYLIEVDPSFAGNYYEQIHNDTDFTELAKEKYLLSKKQRMQPKQINALIKETVLSLEEHHTVDNIKNLFSKLNEKYGGHYITELALHRDEGHFIKNGLTYYPTKDILYKNGDWYVKSDELKTNPTNDDFNIRVNIDEFEKVYNIHAHVKFSMYDLDTGETGRMTKGQVSERLRFVANELGLAYKPDEKVNGSKNVNQVKNEHKNSRDLKAYILKLEKENTQLKETINKLMRRGFTLYKNTKLQWANLFASNRVSKLEKQLDKKTQTYNKLLQKYTKLKEINKFNQHENSYIKKDLAKLKDLRSEFKSLKQELIDTQEAKQEDYNAFNKLKRELESQIREKGLTIQQLEENIEDFRSNNETLQLKNDASKEIKEQSPLSDLVQNYKEHLDSQNVDAIENRGLNKQNKY